MASTIPDEFVPLHVHYRRDRAIRAAGANVEVRAITAGTARSALMALAERLRKGADHGATRCEMVDSERQNRTTPRAGALTPGVPSGPRPQSDTTERTTTHGR